MGFRWNCSSIRRDHDRGELPLRALAAEYRVPRRSVKQAWSRRCRRRASSVTPLNGYRGDWSMSTAPMWVETTVRDHVRKRRRELGFTAGEVFVLQVHASRADR